MANFNLDQYATVEERIEELFKEYPEATIRTFLVKHDGPEVVFEARVYRTIEEARLGIYTSGFAREIEGKSPVNKTSHLENCETSAIGRALANLGYGTSANRPSRSEMLKVARQQEEHQALLEYIRAVGAKVPAGTPFTLGEEEHDLKEYVRKEWGAIKEQALLAHRVVAAIENATEIPFQPAAA